VQSPIPRLASALLELIEGRIVHEDQHDVVSDGMVTETKKGIVTGVDPAIPQAGAPK